MAASAARGSVLPLLVVEPGYWRLAETSHRQYQFWAGAASSLAAQIAARGGALHIHIGSALDALDALRGMLGPFDLWSHQETGNGWTHQRDRAVRNWCKANGITWTESPQFGVIRGQALNRDTWSKQWDIFMSRPQARPPARMNWHGAPCTMRLPQPAELGLHPDGIRYPQAPDRAAALALLDSFLHQRGAEYARQMSSPITAETACSRLSPHLAYGTVSMREVSQAAHLRAGACDPVGQKRFASALRAFISRLHWHCHFIQKLETEPAIETAPFVRAFANLRPRPANSETLSRWIAGRTGYPFLDAAMRYLIAHGWINFRMRAMLMSFATYDLWLPWQDAGAALARLFTDYEPGIHWPQCQMQSGETGINTMRVYSPVKQGFDQDPNGHFIRAWVPELAKIPGLLIHEPWRFDASERSRLCPDYPARIVEHESASRLAKDRLHAARQHPAAQREADSVQHRHGSRQRTSRRFKPAAANGQKSLFI